MILSMTGYGSAQQMLDGVCYAVEVRSVNNRFLKLSIKLPEHLQFAEASVDKLVRRRVLRGTVSFVLRVRSDGAPASRVINRSALQGYLDQLAGVKIPGDAEPVIDLATLARIPGVSEPPEFDEAARDGIVEAIEQAGGAALDGLVAMRREEGKALRKDLDEHTSKVRSELELIRGRSPHVITEYYERLKARVAQLMQAAQLELDEESLRREIAVYAERCDISEEVNRLGSHLDQFAELCDRGEQVGRTLDFLSQEMLREANTIGSKANDGEIARGVVLIKGLIDRIKEQVQNIE